MGVSPGLGQPRCGARLCGRACPGAHSTSAESRLRLRILGGSGSLEARDVTSSHEPPSSKTTVDAINPASPSITQCILYYHGCYGFGMRGHAGFLSSTVDLA